MLPNSPNVTITFNSVALLNRSAYFIDGVENNPTLTLVKGHTYKLNIDVPEPHRIYIKTQLGQASTFEYSEGLKNNGTAEITWRVSENAPARLVYQSWSTPEISGAIEISDVEPIIPTHVNDIGDLREALEKIEKYLIYRPVDLAGTGLKMEHGKLALANTYANYLINSAGTIYSTQDTFTVNDDEANLLIPPTNLQTWLNYVSASLRKLKGTTSYTDNSPTLTNIQGRLDNVLLEIQYIESKLP